MTEKGNDLVKNCKICYYQNGYGIALVNDGPGFVCPHCSSRYVIEGGYAKKV